MDERRRRGWWSIVPIALGSGVLYLGLVVGAVLIANAVTGGSCEDTCDGPERAAKVFEMLVCLPVLYLAAVCAWAGATSGFLRWRHWSDRSSMGVVAVAVVLFSCVLLVVAFGSSGRPWLGSAAVGLWALLPFGAVAWSLRPVSIPDRPLVRPPELA